jgi:transcriptional regulator with XRE-family HTH domain
MTANQVVASNLRFAREIRGLTQAQAAEQLEPYLGTRWSKATFSSAERSAEDGARVREFSANEILAFSRAFGFPILWFFLPRSDEGGELSAVTCGGEREVAPRELMLAALPHASSTSVEGPRLRSLMQRPELRDATDERLREAAHARVDALALADSVTDLLGHTGNLRRLANALEGAETTAQRLFIAAYNELKEE